KPPEIEQNRIYISRQKATSRRVLNETLLEPLLNEYGFQVLICEQLSLAEQIRLFSNTEAIVGPHGAGLANIMYPQHKISIGEICCPPTVPCYLVIARQLGHSFSRLQADPVGDNKIGDMSLTSEKLKSWLKTL
ncbi:glycosyltransferase family 61 protein, partial [Cronbergia sp. UHCC 0137]|uniref:glycosyltransferase family 61 protein n=1 Tax=Cronbergia sp. UHCC 0137 TaxID=3110239 RepID=UPI002B209DB2